MAGFETQGLDHLALTVRDQAASERWYAEVLGLRRLYEEEWGLHPVRALHVAFRVDRANFDAARASLAEHGVEVRFADHGLAHSIYFEDPDGHRLELTTYEV